MKMKLYEKPLVLENEELSEGVYAASGTTTATNGCDSIYMLGVFHPLVNHSDADANHTQGERGCEGCPAFWGTRCGLTSPYFNKNQDLRPAWEKHGYKPSDSWTWS